MKSALTPDLLTTADEGYGGYPAQYPPPAAWAPLRPADIMRAWERAAAADPPFGLYVHLPFCRSVCRFCGILYRKKLASAEELDEYLEALTREAESRAPALGSRVISSMFWGGGTPTLIGAARAARLLGALSRLFKLGSCRFGVEANPGSLDDATLGVLNGAGLDYLSLGVQSLDAPVLRRAGRIHTAEQAREAFSRIRSLTTARINVDLMAGLDGQTAKSFLSDVLRVAGWGPDSIHLSYFKPTKASIWKKSESTRSLTVLWRRWVVEGFRILEENGYRRHGEFRCVRGERPSDQGFAAADLSGRAAVLGLGVGAFSYVHRTLKTQNYGTIARYCRALLKEGRPAVEKGCLPTPRQNMIHFVLSELDKRGEVVLSEFESEFGRRLEDCFKSEARGLSALGVWRRAQDRYVLSSRADARFELARTFYDSSVVSQLLKEKGRKDAYAASR